MFHIDVYEPSEIEHLLKPVLPIQRSTLNQSGLADYFWQDVDGSTIQVERKQWGEILSDIDHIEEQLSREIPMCDQTYLLIEGIYTPYAEGIHIYEYKESGGWFRRKHSYVNPTLYYRAQSFLWQLDKHGVSIVHTSTMAGTATTLAAMYKQSQRANSEMFSRYIRKKPNIKIKNPHVLTLMGIKGVELGQKRAESLITTFGTTYNVLNQSVESLSQVEYMGKATATQLLEATGANLATKKHRARGVLSTLPKRNRIR